MPAAKGSARTPLGPINKKQFLEGKEMSEIEKVSDDTPHIVQGITYLN